MESKTLGIYPAQRAMFESEQYLKEVLYPDMHREYYWSSDFSPEFYIAQAKAGCIAICETIDGEELLLPEMQRGYAVLDFADLHISRKVAEIIRHRPLELSLSVQLDPVAERIDAHHRTNWLTPAYLEILKRTEGVDRHFKALSVSLFDAGVLVAGEIGYTIGQTYTSLTGFSSREKRYRDYGKVQMVLLGQALERQGFSFWNLGHPYMPYKTALGAKIYTRTEFLRRWYPAIFNKELV